MILPELYPFGVRIDIQALTPDEANQRLTAGLGEGYGQIRWRGYRRHYGHPSGQRFLHDFEGDASADKQNVAAQREQAVEQTITQNFVHRVMPPHIFAGHDQVAGPLAAAGATPAR